MSTRVAMTVDLEPDCPPFLSGFRGVERGLPRLVELFEQHAVRATFFTTGDVARRYPAAVRSIVDAGHELACHGMTHTAFDTMDRVTAQREIEQSARILREHAPVTSFRAPYLRFPSQFLPLLEDDGFTVDSSHAKYKLAYHRERATTKLTRVPASVTSSVLRLPRPVRRTYLAALSDPVVLFVHPWEFVDLRRERLRYDCRFRTGDMALQLVGDVLARYRRAGAEFTMMREFV